LEAQIEVNNYRANNLRQEMAGNFRRELAAGKDYHYEMDPGALPQWEFVGFNDLHEIEADEPGDGFEIYSEMAETDLQEWVRPTKDLRIFWSEVNKHRTAHEIIEGEFE
jgi:hypothetical protein